MDDSKRLRLLEHDLGEAATLYYELLQRVEALEHKTYGHSEWIKQTSRLLRLRPPRFLSRMSRQ